MSNATNPLTTVLDAQRTTIEQSRDVFKQSIDFQRRTTEALVDTLKAQQSAQTQTSTIATRAVDAYFDALEASIPGADAGLADARSAAHDNLDRFDAVQDETWDATIQAIEEGLEAYDTLSASYAEGADSAFDIFLDAHEHAGNQLNKAADLTADAVEIDVTD